jgi:hypothetical protein
MPVAIIGNHNHGNFAAEYFFHAPVEAFGVAFQLVEAAVINDSGVTIIRVAYVHDVFPLNPAAIPPAQRRPRTKENRHNLMLVVYTFPASRLCR